MYTYYKRTGAKEYELEFYRKIDWLVKNLRPEDVPVAGSPVSPVQPEVSYMKKIIRRIKALVNVF